MTRGNQDGNGKQSTVSSTGYGDMTEQKRRFYSTITCSTVIQKPYIRTSTRRHLDWASGSSEWP